MSEKRCYAWMEREGGVAHHIPFLLGLSDTKDSCCCSTEAEAMSSSTNVTEEN